MSLTHSPFHATLLHAWRCASLHNPSTPSTLVHAITIFFWFQSSPHHDSAYHQPPSLYLSKTFPYHPIGPGNIAITILSVTLFPHLISYQSPSSTSGWYADPPILNHPNRSQLIITLEYLYLRIYFPIMFIPSLQYSSFLGFCT
jgi:hypothetical protein